MRESIQRYVDNETGIKWIPVPGHKPRAKKARVARVTAGCRLDRRAGFDHLE